MASGGVTPQPVSMDKPKTWKTNSVWLGEDVRCGLRIRLTVHKGETPITTNERWLAAFDVKSSDTLVLWTSGIGASLAIAMLSSLFGGWAATQLFGDDSPQRVIIIDEPTPASQSETGNNEP